MVSGKTRERGGRARTTARNTINNYRAETKDREVDGRTTCIKDLTGLGAALIAS